MCECNMDVIEAECGRNAPGLKTTLYIGCSDDISSIGTATNHAVSTITQTPTTGGFIPWAILRKDNDEKTTPNENGGWTTVVKGFISKQAAAKSNVLTNADGTENFIVITKDQNDVMDIIGSTDHYCKIHVESVKTPKNGYNVTITWEEHANLPYIFTGTVPIKP